MTSNDMRLKVHYELRNHIGSIALREEGTLIGNYYRDLYKRIRKDRTKRYLEEAEENLNRKLEKLGRLTFNDIYAELGIQPLMNDDILYSKY